MLTNSFALPLQIRLDGTALKLVPNPHQKLIFPTYIYIGQYSGLGDQNRPEATFYQKLATDGASPELTPTHTESL